MHQGILAKETAQNASRIFVCIDGIDHAARANASISFLSTLPLPTEVPDGVCFVVVGQPSAVYREQYPMWLSTSEDVARVTMPKLCAGDIEQLILAHASQFLPHAAGLASLIFEKTEGNNLSAVFAVEEIKTFQTLDDAVDRISHSGITADIQQYYEHIWAHMKTELSRIVKVATFPESIIACPLLLMNGRVNVRILSRALVAYGMSESDWTMILDRLYPLVIPTELPGEYALFHNDFRVFLMGVVSEYQLRYEEIALELAKDLFQNEEGLLTYITAIPLLECGNKAHLIPRYFTPGFVVNALAEGVSKQRLDEFAHISYRAACDNRDVDGLCNTYLAVKTLYQHNRYFEYFDRKYNCNDYPEISFVDISEIRTLPVEKQNLDEFEKVLSLCRKLYSSRLSNHRSRAITLYQKWFEQLTPLTFLPLCIDIVPEENDWELRTTEVGFFLQHWGNVTAELDLPVPHIEKPNSRLEMRSIITYGEQYFNHCISHQKYALAIAALTEGYVPVGVFCEKLEILYYEGASKQFEHFLSQVPADVEKDTWVLLAQAMKVTCDPGFIPDRSLFESLHPIKRVYDEACFAAVLQAFLLGCINREIDDSVLIDLVSERCSELEGDDNEKEQFRFFVLVSSLLGKYYWNATPISGRLAGYITWFLSAKLTRQFDYSKARRFLLYTLLHSHAGRSYCAEEWFIDALHTSLFEIDSLGMYYKTDILDYLKQHGRMDIIGEYIKELYGENCCNISLVEDKAELHAKFLPYGKLVYPDMMQTFSHQLKWDVVDKIRKYISVNDELEECPEDRYAEQGDFGVPVIRRNLNSILYAEEKSGKWEPIPLLSRKSRLIPVEDPFLLTEMPRMVFDETWFPSISNEYSQEENSGLSDEQMAAIVQGDVAEGEIVLAACLWYPWRHKKGKKYCEYSKVGAFMNPYQSDRENWSIGNYGLLAYEGTIDAATDESLYWGGINLFNNLGGIHRLYHGNCQQVPSEIWRKYLGCKPSAKSPYIWVDENNCEVLYFERIASPHREAMHEEYIRQPLLFRWVCKLAWLEKTLRDKGLEIWWVAHSEDYPHH